MSYETMKNRLNYLGGEVRQNRMINSKVWSLDYALKNSYQAATLRHYPVNTRIAPIEGLIQPVLNNEMLDTKLISAQISTGLKVGSIFEWDQVWGKSLWLIYLQDLSEIAYLKAHIRRCNFIVKWVVPGDKNDPKKHPKQIETPICVIGPQENLLRTSSSMQADIAEDFPNQTLTVLLPNTDGNKKYFNRYQHFIIDGITYRILNVDNLSMPGIIKLHAIEHYNNLVDDDIELDVANSWNVHPIIPEDPPNQYAPIIGPKEIQPQFEYEFKVPWQQGFGISKWIAYLDLETKQLADVTIISVFDPTPPPNDYTIIKLKWNPMKSGNFVLTYQNDLRPNETNIHHVHVNSLF